MKTLALLLALITLRVALTLSDRYDRKLLLRAAAKERENNLKFREMFYRYENG